ncbi:MAG: hypothetical protein LBC84_01080 [Prevotellaceae bacterium]|jgi:hypothetical protein|nr:hypothetical protein [Prevotellaceae bacterium]
MELKEFVKETLVQITEGVKEAQEECGKIGGLINPMLKVQVCNAEKYRHADSDYPATRVDFKVALTESNTKGGKMGIGVFLGKISIGKETNKEAEMQSATSVEFSITAVFPYIDREGKHFPLSSLNLP